MKKINDLYNDKNKEVDVSSLFPISQSKPKKKLWANSLKDIFHSLKKIDLRGQKIVQYYKNYTHNFDGIGHQNKRLVIDMNSWEVWMSKNLQNIKQNISSFLPKNKIKSPRFIIWGIIVLIIYIAVGKYVVENQVKSWYEKLANLGEIKTNLGEIEAQVGDAKLNFYVAKAFFLPYYLIPTETVENGKKVINGGIQLATTLKELLSITEDAQNFVAKKGIQDVKFSQLLINIQPALIKAQQEIYDTIQSYKTLQLDDIDMQKKLETNVKKLAIWYSYLQNINAHFDTILDILWHTKEKKYLIVFQNSDEIRPTGGFMGSMAILWVFRGQITEFSPKDVYDLEWNLKKSGHPKEAAPEWLNKITDSFGLRDANYFTTFDESSNKIKFFVENAGFPIDGVIYLNQNVILDFLKVTWAVNFEKIWTQVDAKNFSEILSILVESKKFKSGTLDTPKQILFDFVKAFESKIKEQWAYKSYVKILLQNLQNREIVFYPFDKNTNEFVDNFWITGNINYFWTMDYMYPVFTSISWNKSDRYIKRSFEKYIIQKPDCSLDTTFRIIQTDTFSQDDENRIKQEFATFWITDNDNALLNIQGKWPNKQYVRIVVPKEAIIKESKNIKIEEYSNRKSVNFYTEVNPNETKVFDISYTLKNESCKNYNFELYKQPWIPNYNIKVEEVNRKENTYKERNWDFYYEVRK